VIAVATGASPGLGEAFASRLAGDGWDLVITARRSEQLAALARQLATRHGVSAQTGIADLVLRALICPRRTAVLDRVGLRSRIGILLTARRRQRRPE
jgi:NADP-dependent 3-hydroxy acid dehydrogenase YdfG